jgi:hypothetical protein
MGMACDFLGVPVSHLPSMMIVIGTGKKSADKAILIRCFENRKNLLSAPPDAWGRAWIGSIFR